MAEMVVLIFHRPASADDPPLVRLLADVRGRLVDSQKQLFQAAGASEVRVSRVTANSFGELLAASAPATDGLVVLSGGAVPRLTRGDAERLVAVAESGAPVALTNNRHSSDVCAIGDARVLRGLPPLPSDNALPRWLEERAGLTVSEMAGRERLALDIDSPLDIALWALAPEAPRWVRDLVDREAIGVPRAVELRALATDPRRELLVFGRAGSTTLRWLERNVRCRVRFLAEERGLRASSPLAIGGAGDEPVGPVRPPRATLGRLLDHWGPEALGSVVAELADGAILDTRVLMADRFGADESAWPPAADRFASDLLRAADVSDSWLRALTAAAAASPLPIVLGAHSLVGPGIPPLLRARSTAAPRC
jgi:CTP:molybdopterin cytidylyltransferase MocA